MDIVSQAMDGLEHISDVVDRNVGISQNSEQVSAVMDGVNLTNNLLNLHGGTADFFYG